MKYVICLILVPFMSIILEAQISRQHPGAVYYEIFVRSFSDSNGDGIGDIPGIIEKLDYLKNLGIKGIWLTPVHPSPTYHKYDVVDYASIDPEYGTISDMKKLVKEAHERDISIIMDYVANHTSSKHPWFLEAISDPNAESREFYSWADESESFRWKPQSYNPGLPWQWHMVDSNDHSKGRYYGFFWREMPDLNFDNKTVRKIMIEQAKFWLSEVGIDGFRLDAAQHVYELNEHHKSIAWWEEFRAGVESVNKNVYLVGEIVNADSIVTGYFSGLKANFHFDLGKKIISMLQNEQAPLHLIDDLTASIKAHKNKRSDCIDAIFLTNHDQARIMSEVEGNEKKARLAATILLTLPGQPYLYYGEEIGMLGKKPDEAIREPFQWTDNGIDMHTTTWEPLRFNTEKHRSLEARFNETYSIYHQYKELILLRHSTEDILSDFIVSYPMSNEFLAYERGDFLLVHNLTAKKLGVSIPIQFELIKQFPSDQVEMNRDSIAAYATLLFHKKK